MSYAGCLICTTKKKALRRRQTKEHRTRRRPDADVDRTFISQRLDGISGALPCGGYWGHLSYGTVDASRWDCSRCYWDPRVRCQSDFQSVSLAHGIALGVLNESIPSAPLRMFGGSARGGPIIHADAVGYLREKEFVLLQQSLGWTLLAIRIRSPAFTRRP